MTINTLNRRLWLRKIIHCRQPFSLLATFVLLLRQPLGGLPSQKLSRSIGKFDFAEDRTPDQLTMRAMRCHCAKQPLVYPTRQISTISRHAGNRTQIVKEKVVCSKNEKNQASKSARCGIRAHAHHPEPDLSQTS